jgi:hypothetical protein
VIRPGPRIRKSRCFFGGDGPPRLVVTDMDNLRLRSA